MGLEAVLTPSHNLQSLTEIWGHVLFWSFLLSILIFVGVGIFLGITLPLPKKRLRWLTPVLYLTYALLRLIFVEAIASALLAGIYVTSGWCMRTGVAIAWGLGLSLGTNLLSMIISCIPLYAFL